MTNLSCLWYLLEKKVWGAILVNYLDYHCGDMIMHKPLHPGLIVKDALINGADLTITEAAERLGITRTTLSRLLNGHVGISSGMALRLSRVLGVSIEMWMNLQVQYDGWLGKQ